MLTPQEISGKEFVKAVFGGYDMSAVDDFLEMLTTDYAALYKENAILKSKIKVLVEKVEEYRSTDDAMRMALLTAQRMSEEITAEARKKSEEVLKKADLDVRSRQSEMKNKFTEEQERLKSIKTETNKYIKASQEIIRQHSQFLSKLEEIGNETVVPLTYKEPEPMYDEEPEAAPVVDEIADIADEIGSSVYSITDPEADPFSKLFKKEETDNESSYSEETEDGESEDDEPTSPRPIFDFNNLKFGTNYTGE